MPNMSLLQFILQLLGDDGARAEFAASPHQVLRENGFDDLCAEDVRDARPLIVDNVQTAQSNSFDRELNGGGNSTQVHHTPPPPSDGGGGGGGHGGGHGGHGGHGGDGGMDGAIQEIHYITQTYSWSDSHNTVLDNSVNQNIWADGDVVQWFDNDPVVASGDGAVAAGDDIGGTVTTGDRNVVGQGNEVNHVGSASAATGGAVSIGDGEASGEYEANDYSTDVEAYGSGNVAVASNGSDTDQNDSHDWEYEDSHDTDNSVEIDDSYNTENETETNTDNSVEIEDSFNNETDNSVDVEVDDSFNTETDTDIETDIETNTDNSVEIDDSFNFEPETDIDNSVEVEDSFNTETDVDILSNNDVEVEDAIVVV